MAAIAATILAAISSVILAAILAATLVGILTNIRGGYRKAASYPGGCRGRNAGREALCRGQTAATRGYTSDPMVRVLHRVRRRETVQPSP